MTKSHLIPHRTFCRIYLGVSGLATLRRTPPKAEAPRLAVAFIKNGIHITIDGKPADDVPVAPAGQCWKAPTVFDTVHIGWESYHGNMPVELWIDDVAVGDQPIPCPTGPATKP